MNKHLIITLALFLFSNILVAQKLFGIVTDKESSEPLIGVNVLVETFGTATEYDGSYSLDLKPGNYDVTFSYVGFEDVVKTITMGSEPIELNVVLGGGQLLDEVTVVADIAIERKTPVAFTNIPTAKIQEELATQDIPMILNSTPGAYATASGGGDGDARITIRGFNQRNVAVMLDGVPVNDMENGWVYWSNWFGLDLVTKTMQVQRGLGASKLAIPSVGGTINILTKGIDAKFGGRFKQEVGNDGYLRSTLGITSGRLENGWGVSAAASYKRGNGWVDGAYTEGFFYYLRLDKQMGKHLISLSGFGAPQEHGQRPFTQAIAKYDAGLAVELGVPLDKIVALGPLQNRGLRYNQFVGTLNGKEVNSSLNYYHKPQISLRHSWQANEKFFLSNVAYLSLGNGGGARVNDSEFHPETGQMDLQRMYDLNTTSTIFKEDGLAEFYLRSSVNNHFWVGLLSTFKNTINQEWTLSGGLDLRHYRGEHYRTVRDLMGGDFFYGGGRNARTSNVNNRLGVGDIFQYHYDGFVRWGGVFGLLEYSKDKWSTFFNVSGGGTGYKMVDYLWAEEVFINGEKQYVSYFDDVGGALAPDILERVVVDNGILYTVDNPSEATKAYAEANGLIIDSSTPKNQTIDWLWKPSFTFKTGASYNIDDHHNVFVNTGYFSKAPRYNNMIYRFYQDRILREDDITGAIIDTVPQLGKIFFTEEPNNEKVLAFELGYGFKSSKFSANVNAYYTTWDNKPLDFLLTVLEDATDPDSERIPVNISGIAARHQGVEIDFAYKFNKQLTVEGLASLGDWIWNSAADVVLPNGDIYDFDAKGVRVGDAAQTQLGGLVRYEPIKGLYFKIKGTYFGRNFSNFQPESLRGEDAGKQSWQMPDYFVTSFHSGYRFKINSLRMALRFNVLNLLDEVYISDARNNDRFVASNNEGFNAQSASVHFGQGRRWSTALTISF